MAEKMIKVKVTASKLRDGDITYRKGDIFEIPENRAETYKIFTERVEPIVTLPKRVEKKAELRQVVEEAPLAVEPVAEPGPEVTAEEEVVEQTPEGTTRKSGRNRKKNQ